MIKAAFYFNMPIMVDTMLLQPKMYKENIS